MNPSQFAATTILPLLARIVLALAFLPQGWNNLMVITEYTGTDAQRLRELGIRGVSDPQPPQPDVSLGAIRGWDRVDADAWLDADARGDADAFAGTREAGRLQATPPSDSSTESAPRPAPRGPESAPVLTTPRAETLSPLAPLSERGLYRLALYADGAQLLFPVPLAWAVSAIQLLGGGCMLIGIFSRVWGLLMAVILVGVFVTGTMPSVQGSWFFGMNGADFNLVFAQMGLFVLALGVFMVGPGALSLDRAIFRTSRGARKTATRTA